VGLLGYSFGAAVALPVACADERVKAVALISMPPASQVSQLRGCLKPKLMACGTDDFVVPLDQAKLLNQEAAEPKQIELVDGADHFWLGYETVLAEKVVAFFENKIKS
jgi:alpha/beta superfamily hydrolase